MTREEAHRILSNGLLNSPSEHEWCMAFEMAIKALEQEPCNDLISRQAVLEQTYNWSKDEFLSVTNPFDYLRKRINSLPSVNPQEPKTGRWIYEKRKRLMNETDEGAEYITDYWCKCSKCGGDFGYIKMKDAFCKYCGAKMVEPQERSDKE